MAISSRSPEGPSDWNDEARAHVVQAKVLSENKLEQLVARLQRHSRYSREKCWRFVIQFGIKDRVEHRRWTDTEVEVVREELAKHPIYKVARKLNRSPKAIRNMLQRHAPSVREIRCDIFSLEGVACALRVRKKEILHWIKENWLQAAVVERGKRKSYIITPEALGHLYKHHLPKLIKRGIPNLSLFEAYVLYCYSSKHAVETQLLDVRRDKRERAAYASVHGAGEQDQEEEEMQMNRTAMKDDITSISDRATNPATHNSGHNNRCKLCGADVAEVPPESLRERILNIVCGVVLLAVVTAVVYGGEQWISVHVHFHLAYPLWHEPLENWNQL